MRKFFLTQASNTGMGPLPAGADITGLLDNERVALCQMGRATVVEEADAATTQAAILAEEAAKQAAAAAREAEITAAIDASQMPKSEDLADE